MAGKQDKVPALVYNVPGAANQWHWVSWTGPGSRFHPDIPVPYENAEKFIQAHKDRNAEARREWEKFEEQAEARGERRHGRIPWTDPGVPLKLVWITEQQAEKGLEALNDMRLQSESADGGEG